MSAQIEAERSRAPKSEACCEGVCSPWVMTLDAPFAELKNVTIGARNAGESQLQPGHGQQVSSLGFSEM